MAAVLGGLRDKMIGRGTPSKVGEEHVSIVLTMKRRLGQIAAPPDYTELVIRSSPLPA